MNSTKKADINLDIDKGDTLLGGRFKNSPTVVKDIGTDELGQPTVNGKKLLAMRMKKTMPNNDQLDKEARIVDILHRAKTPLRLREGSSRPGVFSEVVHRVLNTINPRLGKQYQRTLELKPSGVWSTNGDTATWEFSFPGEHLTREIGSELTEGQVTHGSKVKSYHSLANRLSSLVNKQKKFITATKGMASPKITGTGTKLKTKYTPAVSFENIDDFNYAYSPTKQAGVDSAPNYTPASDQATKCSKCVHAKDGYCTLYDFDFDPEYTCDSFSTDFNATTTTGVPQVLEKYLPKVAQHKNLNILYGVLNHMKEAQAQQPQGLQHQTTKPAGGPKPPPMTGNNLNASFKNIAQQGIRNGAATAAGVKPKTNNNMSIPYGVNSGGMPYGVNAMSPEMLQAQQAPQKSAQYQPQGYGYPQQQQPDYGMQQYQARLQNTRVAIQNAAAQRYQQMQEQAQQQARQQAAAAQQGQAQLQSYDGGKQAEYLVGFFDKCAEYGVDPIIMNNVRHELLKEASYTTKQKNKVSKVMKEFKDGTLRSGNADGPKVTSRQQAIAIALSEAGVNKK